MSETKLLPCPFCRKEPVFTADTDVTDGFVHSYTIACHECGFHICDEYQDDTANNWNRRVVDDGPLTVSYPVHEIAHNLLLKHTGQEGGCPTIDWYGLRAEISDAIAVALDNQRRIDTQPARAPTPAEKAGVGDGLEAIADELTIALDGAFVTTTSGNGRPYLTAMFPEVSQVRRLYDALAAFSSLRRALSTTKPAQGDGDPSDFMHRLIENAFSWAVEDTTYLDPKATGRLIEATRSGMKPEEASEWRSDLPDILARKAALAAQGDDAQEGAR